MTGPFLAASIAPQHWALDQLVPRNERQTPNIFPCWPLVLNLIALFTELLRNSLARISNRLDGALFPRQRPLPNLMILLHDLGRQGSDFCGTDYPCLR